MTTVYVAVHGEATHHVDDVVGGWFDSNLTDVGLRQARRIAEALRPRITDVPQVLSSDLNRALQTATVIAQMFAVAVESVHDLREIGCGVAEGKSRTWLGARLVPPPLDGNRLDHRICDGAETRREVATRAHRVVEQLIDSRASSVIVVTHGVFLTYLVSAWIGMPVEAVDRVKLEASTGSITVLDVNASWGDRELVTLNETGHLLMRDRDVPLAHRSRK
jgi:2,3-bisphosphoglycerate-dependent phosphoglycerate mutase